jgi:hypothetical protein
MEFECYDLLHGGEGPRGDKVTVFVGNNRSDAAEEAATYFDDVEQRKERCGNDCFDGAVRYIEVVGPDGRSTKHEVSCEVTRSYTDVIR